MEMESFTMTEDEKKQAIKDFMSKVKNFPKEPERKDAVFNSLNSILQALGSYLNDDITFKRETRGDKEYLIYSSVYGSAEQNITGDSVKALLEDSLTLLFANCRELQGSFDVINKRLNSEEK